MLTLIGCSSETEPEIESLSLEQADILANALFRNFEDGAVELKVTRAVANQTAGVTYTGSIDWSQGLALFDIEGDDQTTGIAWTPTVLVEKVPELTAELKNLTGDTVEWFFTPLNENNNRQAASAAYDIIHTLGSNTPDNAVLIRQNPGAGFVSESDTEVILAYSNSSVFTFDTETNLMNKFEFLDGAGNPIWTAEVIDRDAPDVVVPELAIPKPAPAQ